MIITSRLEAVAPVADELWEQPGTYQSACRKLAGKIVAMGEDLGAFLSVNSVRYRKIRNPEIQGSTYGRGNAVLGYWCPPTTKGVELRGGFHDGKVVEVDLKDDPCGYPLDQLVMSTDNREPLDLDSEISPVSIAAHPAVYHRVGINSETDRWVYKLAR